MTGASLEVMSSARPPSCARTHVAGVPPGVSCSAFLLSFFRSKSRMHFSLEASVNLSMCNVLYVAMAHPERYLAKLWLGIQRIALRSAVPIQALLLCCFPLNEPEQSRTR